jgi:hypothetical protein
MKRLIACVAGALLIGALPAMASQAAQEKPKPEAKADTKTHTASGTVTAVSGSSMTVKTSKEEMTFAVDDKTDVTVTGGTTKTQAAKAAGTKTVLTDFVASGDTVTVKYHDMGTEKHAARVQVTHKANVKK